jgi:hypothetical protein
VLLEVADYTGYIAAGGTKSDTYIANEMCTQCYKIGANYFFLVIFDEQVQSPTKKKPSVVLDDFNE